MLAQELVVLMGTIERPREQHHGGWRYDSGESDEKEELWAHLPGRGRGGGAGSLSRCQCNPFSHPMMIRLLVSLCFVVTICMVLTEYRKINTHDRFSLAAAQ